MRCVNAQKSIFIKDEWFKLMMMHHFSRIFFILFFFVQTLLVHGSHAIAGEFIHEQQQLLAKLNQKRLARGIPSLASAAGLEDAASLLLAQDEQKLLQGRVTKLDLRRALKNIGYPTVGSAFVLISSNRPFLEQLDRVVNDKKYEKLFMSRKMTHIGLAANKPFSVTKRAKPVIWALILAHASAPSPADWREKTHRFVNQFRKTQNLPAVRLNPKLNEAAQLYSRRMAVGDFVAHQSPQGDRAGQRAKASHYDWQRILENLHAGEQTARGAVDAWIASKDGHREAMLDPNVKDMGIGYHYMPFDEGKAKYTHYWTLLLGKQK